MPLASPRLSRADETVAVLSRRAQQPPIRRLLAARDDIQQHQAKGEVVTGLLYVDSDAGDLHGHLNTVETPFNRLEARDLCPGTAVLDKINASLR